MPYRDAAGQDIAVRIRLALKKSEGEDQRFRWKTGSKAHPYGLWRLERARAAGYVLLVEGESDAQTLWHHDVPALGIPGARTWREDLARHLEGIPTIYVVIEPDVGGEGMCNWLAMSSIRDRVKLIRLEGAKDPSALYLANPPGFARAIQEAMEKATPWVDRERAQAEAGHRKAWQECQALAQKPDILAEMSADLEKMGVVGEVPAARLIYLCVMTRLLEKPVSAAIKGPSSAGKSYLVGRILSFFPSSAVYVLSGMSERALAYSDEPLSHRMLLIQEAAALQSDIGSYLLRSLLSEGHLRYETVEKTSDGMRPRLIEREGPTGLLITTTEVRLHAENETRLLSIPVTDTPEQTRLVMLATARSAEEAGANLDRWHALQVWLEGGGHRVVVPFAETLAGLIPPKAVRLRRDFRSVLSLIRTHALLHQATRETDPSGRLVATLTDYEAVRGLVADLVAEGVEATVPTRVVETVEAVRALGPDEVTIGALAKQLKLDKSTASRRAREGTSRGYLHNHETRRGQPARLVVGDPVPSESNILPSVLDLSNGRRCAVAVQSEGRDTPTPPGAQPGDEGNGAPARAAESARAPVREPTPSAVGSPGSSMLSDTETCVCPNCGSDRVISWSFGRVCTSCHRRLSPPSGEDGATDLVSGGAAR
jgi:hypothetical protein